MIELKDNGVLFDAVKHEYSINGKILQGVTGIIKTKLFPDEYANVPNFVLQRAAERGTRIHNAVEFYEDFGIETESCEELVNYKRLREAHKDKLGECVKTEYLVTDFEQYASAIDLVFNTPSGGIAIADIKTTSKLNIEYVTWQLSVYAFFMWLCNKVNVDGMFVIYLRDGQSECIELQPKTFEEVRTLLYSDSAPVIKQQTQIVEIADVEQEVVKIKSEMDACKIRYEELSSGLLNIMREQGIKKYEGSFIRLTRKLPSTSKRFDSKSFKDDYPELYEKYCKPTQTSESLLVKVI